MLTLPTAMGTTTAFNAAALVVPEQNLPLAELAGEWNMLDYAHHDGSGLLSADYRSFSATAKGAVQVTQVCSALECSKPVNPLALQMRPNAAGGFTFDYAGGKARAFTFKSADGHVWLAMWLPGSSGGVAFAARQEPLPPPAVGTVSRFWDLQVSNQGVVSLPGLYQVSVTGVDLSAGTVTRLRASDSRVDTLHYNQPLYGLRYRDTGACSVNGVPKNCDGSLMLTLPGTGVTVYAGLAPATYLGVSINQPVAPTPTVPPTPTPTPPPAPAPAPAPAPV
jgi:hypothetical protein